MFTVKLCRTNSSNAAAHTSIACQKYGISWREGFCQVFIYPRIDDEMYAANFILGNKEDIKVDLGNETLYESCFVENMAGKTIEAIRTAPQ